MFRYIILILLVFDIDILPINSLIPPFMPYQLNLPEVRFHHKKKRPYGGGGGGGGGCAQRRTFFNPLFDVNVHLTEYNYNDDSDCIENQYDGSGGAEGGLIGSHLGSHPIVSNLLFGQNGLNGIVGENGIVGNYLMANGNSLNKLPYPQVVPQYEEQIGAHDKSSEEKKGFLDFLKPKPEKKFYRQINREFNKFLRTLGRLF